MLRRLWGRRPGWLGRARLGLVWLGRLRPRLGLRAQIATLGVGGVALIGTVYLVGLQFEGQAQRQADESATLETLIANATEGFLEARRIGDGLVQ